MITKKVVPYIVQREELFPKTRGFVAVKDLETQGVKYLDLSRDLIANLQHIKLFHFYLLASTQCLLSGSQAEKLLLKSHPLAGHHLHKGSKWHLSH